MSEETKKQPETEQEQAAAETKAPAAESDKQEAEPAAEKTEKKDWFGKKSKELEAVKAKLEAAEDARLSGAPSYTLDESRKRLEALYQRG